MPHEMALIAGCTLIALGLGAACRSQETSPATTSPPASGSGEAEAAADAGPPAVDAGPSVSLAGAAPPDRTMRLRWIEAWNSHWAEARGADHANHVGEVTLELWDDGRARVVDAGERQASVLDGELSRKTTTTWRTTWSGRSKQAGSPLELTLRRRENVCSRTEERREGSTTWAPTVTACAAPSGTLTLRCEEGPVEVKGGPGPAAAWRCARTDGAGDAPATPAPWVFAKDGCLEQVGGRFGPTFHRACAP